MQRIVINVCYGGFGLSDAAYEKMAEYGVPVLAYERGTDHGHVIYDRRLSEDQANNLFMGRYWDDWIAESRTHPTLLRVVEEIGETANGHCAELKIVEIPSGIEWEIDEYDGNETIREVHRTWK